MFVHFVVFSLILHKENRKQTFPFVFNFTSEHHNGNSDKIEKEKRKYRKTHYHILRLITVD